MWLVNVLGLGNRGVSILLFPRVTSWANSNCVLARTRGYFEGRQHLQLLQISLLRSKYNVVRLCHRLAGNVASGLNCLTQPPVAHNHVVWNQGISDLEDAFKSRGVAGVTKCHVQLLLMSHVLHDIYCMWSRTPAWQHARYSTASTPVFPQQPLCTDTLRS